MRVSVNDKALVNKARLQQLGAAGVLEVGNSVQAVYGTRSDRIKETMRAVVADGAYSHAAPAETAPAPVAAPTPPALAPLSLPDNFRLPLAGRVLPLSEVPDEVFASKMMGEGFAIMPEVSERAEVLSPVSGEVLTLFPTCLLYTSPSPRD